MSLLADYDRFYYDTITERSEPLRFTHAKAQRAAYLALDEGEVVEAASAFGADSFLLVTEARVIIAALRTFGWRVVEASGAGARWRPTVWRGNVKLYLPGFEPIVLPKHRGAQVVAAISAEEL